MSMTSDIPYRGLSPFLRMSIAGENLQPLAQELLALAETHGDDPLLWMNLSLAMQCLGQHDLGLSMQQQALAMSRVYTIPATVQPARLRLLMLMVPGDISANTPLECLLEDSDIELICYYVTANDMSGGMPLAVPVPEHDAVFVAIGESDDNRETLDALEQLLADWPRPVVNAPQFICTTNRSVASALLQDIPGLQMPPTLTVTREMLHEIAVRSGDEGTNGCQFPIILRPVGSQAGRDLARLASPVEIPGYLDGVKEDEFFLSRFIDYSGFDGRFRKYRIALIDGEPYPCHMAVSSHWMVHYVNAGMYEDAAKRDEEAYFMAHFADFARRHRYALAATQWRTGLDYLCIDCAETKDGQLLIFEIDHVMVVHAMDPVDLFPYKQAHMLKVKDAFRAFLLRLTASREEIS